MRGFNSSVEWSCSLFTSVPIFLHRELLSWSEVLRHTWCRNLARCHSSSVLFVDRCKSRRASPVPLSLKWPMDHVGNVVFLSGINCPVVSFGLPCGLASSKSTISNFLRAFAIRESSTSKSGVIRPNKRSRRLQFVRVLV